MATIAQLIKDEVVESLEDIANNLNNARIKNPSKNSQKLTKTTKRYPTKKSSNAIRMNYSISSEDFNFQSKTN